MTKRILTLALAVVMAMSVLCINVTAADPNPTQTGMVNVEEVLLENTEVPGGWQAIYKSVNDTFLNKLTLPNAKVTIVVDLETAPDWYQFQVRNSEWAEGDGQDINLTPVTTDEGISYTVSGAALKAAFDTLDPSKKPFMLVVNNGLTEAYTVVKLVLSYDEEDPNAPQTEIVNVEEVLLENTEVPGGWQAIYQSVNDTLLNKLTLPNAKVTIVVDLETAPDWYQFQVRNSEWAEGDGQDINLTPVTTDEGISYTVTGAELKAAFDTLDPSKKPFMLVVNNGLTEAYTVVKLVLSYDEERVVTPPDEGNEEEEEPKLPDYPIPMRIGSAAVHGVIVNGRMLPMPHRFINGVCVGCGYVKKVDISVPVVLSDADAAEPVDAGEN